MWFPLSLLVRRGCSFILNSCTFAFDSTIVFWNSASIFIIVLLWLHVLDILSCCSVLLLATFSVQGFHGQVSRVYHKFVSLPVALCFCGLGPCYITGPVPNELAVCQCLGSTLPLFVFVGSSAFSLQFLVWYATPQNSVAGFSRWSGHTILCQGKEISRGQTYFIFRRTGTQ